MPNYDLKQMYAIEDKDGNPLGYGPGVTEVPEADVAKIEQRFNEKLDDQKITQKEAKAAISAANDN